MSVKKGGVSTYQHKEICQTALYHQLLTRKYKQIKLLQKIQRCHLQIRNFLLTFCVSHYKSSFSFLCFLKLMWKENMKGTQLIYFSRSILVKDMHATWPSPSKSPLRISNSGDRSQLIQALHKQKWVIVKNIEIEWGKERKKNALTNWSMNPKM